MIIKQDGLHYPAFIRLLEYLTGSDQDGEQNQFWYSDLSAGDLDECPPLGARERRCLIREGGGVALPFLRSFARLKSVTIDYEGVEMYCNVAIEMPDHVKAGVTLEDGSLKKGHELEFSVTSNRIMLEIWNILKDCE